jgi:hypothetical protein
MPETKKNTLTTHSTKPVAPPSAQHFIPPHQMIQKPQRGNPRFNTVNAFRNQNRGSGGK